MSASRPGRGGHRKDGKPADATFVFLSTAQRTQHWISFSTLHEHGPVLSQQEQELRARAAYHFPTLDDGTVFVRDALGRIIIPDGEQRRVKTDRISYATALRRAPEPPFRVKSTCLHSAGFLSHAAAGTCAHSRTRARKHASDSTSLTDCCSGRNKQPDAKDLVPLMLVRLGPKASGLADYEGKSALRVALENRRQDVALLLVDAADADTLKENYLGENCLHAASRLGLAQVALKLLERQDVILSREKNAAGQSALHVALTLGLCSPGWVHREEVAALLAAKMPLEALRQGDSMGETCLHVAVRMGFQDVALRIVERGGAEVVGAENADGETPLMLIAGVLFGQPIVVSDGTYTAEIFETAKQRELAMAFVDKAAAEALLIPSKEGTTCLQAAVLSGLTEVALKIMSRVGEECLVQCGRFGLFSPGPLPPYVSPRHATLTEDYSKLLEETALADVTFEVDGERFPAYRGVLAVRSAYFKAMFTSAMRCSVAGQDIKLEEVSAGAFRMLLAYLYAGTLPWIEEDWGPTSLELAQMADRFQVEGLYQHFVSNFREGLCPGNVVERLVQVHDSGLAALEDEAMDYLRANALTFQVQFACLCSSYISIQMNLLFAAVFRHFYVLA